MRRIVVTGLGAVTPLAAGVEASWSRLLAGRSGIRRLPDDVVGDLPAKVGGVVPSLEEDPDAGFDPDAVLAPKDQRKVDRFILFALAAAEEALAQAKWKPASETDRLRTATIIASGIGGFPAITEAVRTVDSARCPPPVAVYDTVLPGESRGGPHLDPPWLQRSTGRAGDGVRGRHPGDRRCGSSYPRKRSRHRRVRWNGSVHEHRQSRWFCCRTLPFHRLQ